MTSLGLRANNTEIYYAVLSLDEHSNYSIEALSYLIIPVSLNFPEKLNFVRKTFKDIIFEYSIKRAGIRITETVARRINPQRLSYEAILQEVLASSSIEKYMTGQISNISARLGIPRENFKKIISGDVSHNIFNAKTNYSSEEKEAILAGIAALNL